MPVQSVSLRVVGLFVTAATLLYACVFRTEHTINAHITLDIRHIQEQAAGVLDFVEGRSDTLPGLETASDPGPQSLWHGLRNALDPIPAAWADNLKNTTSPLVTDLARRMRERHPRIDAYRQTGCFGENNRGYLELPETPPRNSWPRKTKTEKPCTMRSPDSTPIRASPSLPSKASTPSSGFNGVKPAKSSSSQTPDPGSRKSPAPNSAGSSERCASPEAGLPCPEYSPISPPDPLPKHTFSGVTPGHVKRIVFCGKRTCL